MCAFMTHHRFVMEPPQLFSPPPLRSILEIRWGGFLFWMMCYNYTRSIPKVVFAGTGAATDNIQVNRREDILDLLAVRLSGNQALRMVSLSHTLTHTLTHSHTHTLTHSHSHTFHNIFPLSSLLLSLLPSRAYTHTRTHTHTHTHTLPSAANSGAFPLGTKPIASNERAAIIAKASWHSYTLTSPLPSPACVRV